jgi:hypothetical protein
MISYGLTIAGNCIDLEKALPTLLLKIQSSKHLVWDATATHQQKWAFVSPPCHAQLLSVNMQLLPMMQVASLGMQDQLVSLEDLAKSPKLQEKLGIYIIIHKHSFEDMIPLHTVLWDSELTEENG